MAGGMGSPVRLTTASISTGPSWASAAAMPLSTSAGSSSRIPPTPQGSAHAAKVRVLELGAEVEKARGLLFDLDEAERAVVEHHDLYRQAELRKTEKIAHQHGETAITRQRDHLPARKRRLRANRMRHRIGHRAMPERSDQPSLAVHRQIARGPHRR